MKKNLICTHCSHKWSYGYWEWVWKAQLHVFNFFIWKDKRYTKCPKCGKRSWLYCE